MNMPLEKWQQRLEEHFSRLASTKAASAIPLFALEHGLDEHELQEIGSLLRERLSLGLRLEPHWLLWVVYATEIGYIYDGEEYWNTFEEFTPRWCDHGSRSQLRLWFSKFRTKFHAVTPSGPWAEWFSIIAWPITHAVLPKYLQWQFAKALYELRYRLAGLHALSPADVGELLASNAWDASTRFQEFLQQQELAGRIVLALLSEGERTEQTSIYPDTLERLVSDLERVQSAREWLKETRRFVVNQMKGTISPQAATPGTTIRNSDAEEQPALRIRPSLLLRRSGPNTWSAALEIPSFAPLAARYPELRAFLAGTRCKIASAGDTWLPRGWLLSSAQRRILKSWPDPEVPLITFERPNTLLEPLLQAQAHISKGRLWLFRIGQDGLAREIVGRTVRPNKKYIILGEADSCVGHPLLSPCDLECEGICAAVLNTPNILSTENLIRLQGLGLQVVRTIQVCPAGLCAGGWDGEGYSEWLTTETPCFGIVHDHPVEGYILQINNGVETLVAAGEPGVPVFVRVPPLSIGTHTIAIKVRRNASASPLADGLMTLSVRDPEPWIPATTSHPGLVISIDPPDPALNTFWDGDVGVSILGPAGRQITCSIALSSPSGKELSSLEVGTFQLPVTNANWQHKFAKFVSGESVAQSYLEAASGTFMIEGEELGQYVLRLERTLKPLRWICRNAKRAITVRLADDSGKEEDTVVARFFSFDRPTEAIPLDTNLTDKGFEVSSPGGLFAVHRAQLSDAVVVSTPQIAGGLQGLVIEPELRDLAGDIVGLIDILQFIRSWTEARIVGPLVAVRRKRILDRLVKHLFMCLGGQRWVDAENALLSNPHSEHSLRQLERTVGGTLGFALLLPRGIEKLHDCPEDGALWYADVAARYQVSSDKGLCEFALNLASRPGDMLHLPRPVLSTLLADIRKSAVLLRGARLLAILSAATDPAPACSLLPRWKWNS